MTRLSTTPQSSADLNGLIAKIEGELAAYAELSFDSGNAEALPPKWQELVLAEPHRFINDDKSVKIEALQNFRRMQIFIPDNPTHETNGFNIRDLVGGERRGHKRQLHEALAILQEHGYDHLLSKYPCHPAGNPFVYRHQGYSFTFRWAKHIYSLGLMNGVLADKLPEDFIALDIGSSYGIFSSLIKQEYPKSHHILVDFPEQLILAYYFLGTCFPEIKIAGVRELLAQKELSRDFFLQYDFVLAPWPLYERLGGIGLDLVTNFASLGEMSRDYFDYYIDSPTFKEAQYFFTANRIQSLPDYETDLNIRDYPIWGAGKKLHFDISPVFSNVYRYPRRNLFFNERVAYPPYFEYIGEI